MELLDQLKRTSWVTFLKSLSFPGGASSTRWVFLCSFFTVATAFLGLTAAACIAYVRDSTRPIVSMIPLLLGLAGILAGFSSNSQNVKHQLGAEIMTPKKLDASSTPGTGEVKGAP